MRPRMKSAASAGVSGDRQQGREAHRVGLGEGQRPEQAALGCLAA